MAKINWVFQDEQGTNLNRYRATNVETGEEVVFDLLRGGNINVVGTPLNAEKLNSLVNAINDLYDSKLDKTGGTLTGGLTINGATSGYSLNGSGYVKGSWLQSTTKQALTYNATMFVVYDDEGWLYYRSPSQVKSDIGLGDVDNTSDLNKPISSATQRELDLKATKKELKDYVKSTTLSSYVTTTTLDTRLGSYVTTQSLEQTLQDYVENTYLVSNYVTYNNLNSTLQNYAKKSDLPTIPQYYQHNIKIVQGNITLLFSIINQSSSSLVTTITLATFNNITSELINQGYTSVDNLLQVSGYSSSSTGSNYIGLYIDSATALNNKIIVIGTSTLTITKDTSISVKDTVVEL